jgi:hypothetical protein
MRAAESCHMTAPCSSTRQLEMNFSELQAHSPTNAAICPSKKNEKPILFLAEVIMTFLRQSPLEGDEHSRITHISMIPE